MQTQNIFHLFNNKNKIKMNQTNTSNFDKFDFIAFKTAEFMNNMFTKN